jgi:flagellar assembly protein FliH
MMSMSSSPEYTSLFSLPIAALEYREMEMIPAAAEWRGFGAEERPAQKKEERPRAEVEMSEAEFAARIRQERAEAAQQAEQRLRQEYEQKLAGTRDAIAITIKEFAEQRSAYFAKVEAEVVQLSLSIAAKILHRESQVDPMLVATLVRMAVEKMRDESAVTVHVGVGRGAAWQQYCATVANMSRVQIVEDPELTNHDCLLETELGIANFGLDSQLKEVEQGFFDLLALRPAAR